MKTYANGWTKSEVTQRAWVLKRGFGFATWGEALSAAYAEARSCVYLVEEEPTTSKPETAAEWSYRMACERIKRLAA